MFTIHEWFISFCKLIMLPVICVNICFDVESHLSLNFLQFIMEFSVIFVELSVNCMCYFELSVKEWLSIYFYFCYFELHACVAFF
jgi:hypothetical protein